MSTNGDIFSSIIKAKIDKYSTGNIVSEEGKVVAVKVNVNYLLVTIKMGKLLFLLSKIKKDVMYIVFMLLLIKKTHQLYKQF